MDHNNNNRMSVKTNLFGSEDFKYPTAESVIINNYIHDLQTFSFL